jgi:hypothetical protein
VMEIEKKFLDFATAVEKARSGVKRILTNKLRDR